MIEKLKKQNTWGECLEKLNELVDAVNKLDALLDLTNTAIQAVKNETPADPYAEQRKWIGKLCRFRDKLNSKWSYSILKSVDKRISTYPFWDAEDYEWEICEPVSRDDFLLYKGDDND